MAHRTRRSTCGVSAYSAVSVDSSRPHTIMNDRESTSNALGGRQRIIRNLVSGFIALVLGAQIATLGVTVIRPGALAGKLYPIIEYPMYAFAHYDGERIKGRWLLRGVLADGEQLDINEQSLRISVWDYIDLLEPVVALPPNSVQQQTAIQTLITVVRERERRAGELKTLRIDSYPLKLTRHGGEPMPSETVMSIPMA
jgi:hypothetical protein